MARLPRLSVGGWPHLLVLRGHNQQPVFTDAADLQLFREMLAEAARANGVAVHAYALFAHEVHLLASPADATSLGKMMQGLGRRYGGYFNRRHARTGSLWDGRFRSTILEPERHLLDAMRLIEELVVGEAGAPMASSRAHHVGQQSDPIVTDHAQFWSLGNTPFDREMAYRRLLDQALRGADRALLNQAVSKGWPLGSPDFVKRLSASTERRLAPMRRGRPPKAAAGEK